MNFDCIRSWAIARSVYKGANALSLTANCPSCLRPKLLNEKLVSLGDQKDLVFSEKNLLKIREKKFALPELTFLFRHPYSSFKKILILKRFENYIYNIKTNPNYLGVLMSVCLESTAVYMNKHPKCLATIGNDSGIVSFYLQGIDDPLVSLIKSQGNKWHTKTGNLGNESSVRLTFKNIDVGIQSCLGRINPIAATTLGGYEVSGYLPLMDKVGYCARLVGNELPVLI